MFEKILTAVKTKNKNFGLSETILKVLAETLEKTVEKEEDIENAVNGLEGQMKIYQSFADQNRTLADKLKKMEESKGNPQPENPQPENPAPAPTGGEVPEWAKAIIESNKTLSESLTAMKVKETAQTNAQKLQTRLTEQKVSQSYLDLLPTITKEFANDEEIEAYVTELKVKSDAFEQANNDLKISQSPKPLFGEAVKEGEVSADVQALIDSKKQS